MESRDLTRSGIIYFLCVTDPDPNICQIRIRLNNTDLDPNLSFKKIICLDPNLSLKKICLQKVKESFTIGAVVPTLKVYNF